MKVTFFDEKTNDAIVLCLGSFDSIHKGHQKIINFAKGNLDKDIYIF